MASTVAVGTEAVEGLRSSLARREHRHLIGGAWVPSASGRSFPTLDPADGSTLADVALGGVEDVDRAVRAARRALEDGPWSRLAHAERARLLLRLADLIEGRAGDIALLETLDNGKPYRDALEGDVAGALDDLRDYASWATKLYGESVRAPSGDVHGYTVREPVGVAGLIVPWNFPFMIAVSKVAPALAAGCTAVLKPAEQTPLSALLLGELVLEAGFPDGVLNIVTGDGEAGAALVAHPMVDKISFTGSTDVGKAIVRSAADTLKRVTLELGGKSPVVIFPDADLERAIPGAAQRIFSNSGQVCVANSRLFAHRDVFDEVVDGIARRAGEIRVGPGTDPASEIGPLVSEEQLDRVTSLLASGVADGARTVVGGGRVGDRGYFVEPTVLVDTSPEMRVMREEIFGPVIAASAFSEDDLRRVAADANDTSYGLAAYVWTRDLGTAHRMASLLKAGSVRVNGGYAPGLPFGGFKQSGWGRENARLGIEAYTEVKSVAIRL
jgi:phenylacetaldehyde dehydrogenase